MSYNKNKNILNENTVKRFMKLAKIGTYSSSFLSNSKKESLFENVVKEEEDVVEEDDSLNEETMTEEDVAQIVREILAEEGDEDEVLGDEGGGIPDLGDEMPEMPGEEEGGLPDDEMPDLGGEEDLEGGSAEQTVEGVVGVIVDALSEAYPELNITMDGDEGGEMPDLGDEMPEMPGDEEEVEEPPAGLGGEEDEGDLMPEGLKRIVNEVAKRVSKRLVLEARIKNRSKGKTRNRNGNVKGRNPQPAKRRRPRRRVKK